MLFPFLSRSSETTYFQRMQFADKDLLVPLRGLLNLAAHLDMVIGAGCGRPPLVSFLRRSVFDGLDFFLGAQMKNLPCYTSSLAIPQAFKSRDQRSPPACPCGMLNTFLLQYADPERR